MQRRIAAQRRERHNHHTGEPSQNLRTTRQRLLLQRRKSPARRQHKRRFHHTEMIARMHFHMPQRRRARQAAQYCGHQRNLPVPVRQRKQPIGRLRPAKPGSRVASHRLHDCSELTCFSDARSHASGQCTVNRALHFAQYRRRGPISSPIADANLPKELPRC